MKAITLYRPNAVRSTLSDFDRYFESFFRDSLLAPATKGFNHLPAVDIRETEVTYTLDMELPGYEEKDIEIHVDSGNLSIASKHEEAEEKKAPEGNAASAEKQENWILHERRSHSFSRTFRLPGNADPEAISAAFKNGVLSLEIKKREEARKRVIQINMN
ncbi:MAG: Hsp20/alpha crystallin family protein [Treponema sp.]|jgi:HSP20 family protein|nr:Hsp20/alpha crystallin family protein [Treponema sp.]